MCYHDVNCLQKKLTSFIFSSLLMEGIWCHLKDILVVIHNMLMQYTAILKAVKNIIFG